MQNSLNLIHLTHYDLVSPDGKITALKSVDDHSAEATVFIQEISPKFVGFFIDHDSVMFNIKSTLAQLGVDSEQLEIHLDQKNLSAEAKILLKAIGPLGKEMLKHLKVGAIIGKLFADDDRRRVRDPHYLSRMFGRSDSLGRPLLSLGGLQGSGDLILEKIDGRTIAYLTLKHGVVEYVPMVKKFLPSLGQALCDNMPHLRDWIRLHQKWIPDTPRTAAAGELLLVKTLPLHIRTVFARVVNPLLGENYRHTSASVLQPDTFASGDIYELFGNTDIDLTDIPLEFYTLEPYREHVFYSDRDQLQTDLENSQVLFDALATAPNPQEKRSAVYIVKSKQLLNLSHDDWIAREPTFFEFPGMAHTSRHAAMVDRYIEQQPAYPILFNIMHRNITSQGILLSQHFLSPMMKKMLLNSEVQRNLKAIYFQRPSQEHGEFFSFEDRALLHDLHKFAIPTYWVDARTQKILKYVERVNRGVGMFVPGDRCEDFLQATFFGLYGSNLQEGQFDEELRRLLHGVLALRDEITHPLLHTNKPLALVTGGGPGAMEVGNRTARELGILSCANILDFNAPESVVHEQKQNPYIDAKMTFRLDKLVERQAEFHLDFPILIPGGSGTDFEFALEEVRRKTGASRATPIILLGGPEQWRDKITPRFKKNRATGTTKGSEWLSNCFYCVNTAEEGLHVYQNYFRGSLPIGPEGPIFDEGFVDMTTT